MEVVMPLSYRWHFVGGVAHKGPLADCSKCKHSGHAKRVRKSREAGREGGKKSGARKVKAEIPTCKECGVPISRDSKTGLCIQHYNLLRATNKKPRTRKSRHCVNPSCSNHISDSNQSGLCTHCYHDKSVIAHYQVHRDEWLKSLEPLPSRT
jgi:hypothetical protein